MKLTCLTNRPQYLRVKYGSSWRTQSFILEAKARDTCSNVHVPRFGITVSNKTAKPNHLPNTKRGPVSVNRNRMRRRLRAVLQSLAPAHALPNVDYVIIGRHSLLAINHKKLVADLEYAFKKVNKPIINQLTKDT